MFQDVVTNRLESGAYGLERADDVWRTAVDCWEPLNVKSRVRTEVEDIQIGSMCVICLSSMTRIGEPASVLFVTHHASFCQWHRPAASRSQHSSWLVERGDSQRASGAS